MCREEGDLSLSPPHNYLHGPEALPSGLVFSASSDDDLLPTNHIDSLGKDNGVRTSLEDEVPN